MKTHGRKAFPTTTAALGLLLLLAGLPRLGEAQEGAGCPAGEVLEGSVGISGLACTGGCTISFNRSPGEVYWSFSVEPTIEALEEGSPADGVLRPGDRLVSVDGQLITTREGGLRWSRIEPGERVVLGIRRDGRVRQATLTATGRCRRPPASAPPVPDAPSSGGPGATEAPAPPLPDPGRPPMAAALAPPPGLSTPGASLGLSFRCGDCSFQVQETEGGRPPGASRGRWSFSSPPEVIRVEPGGPAERAGIRAGDRIRRVAGYAIESPEGSRAFGSMQVGTPVPFVVARADGSSAELSVTPRATSTVAVRESAPSPERPTGSAPPTPPEPVIRFSGSIGPARIVVRGGPVTVTRYVDAGTLVIRTGDTEIRIVVPRDGGGGEE